MKGTGLVSHSTRQLISHLNLRPSTPRHGGDARLERFTLLFAAVRNWLLQGVDRMWTDGWAVAWDQDHTAQLFGDEGCIMRSN